MMSVLSSQSIVSGKKEGQAKNQCPNAQGADDREFRRGEGVNTSSAGRIARRLSAPRAGQANAAEPDEQQAGGVVAGDQHGAYTGGDAAACLAHFRVPAQDAGLKRVLDKKERDCKTVTARL